MGLFKGRNFLRGDGFHPRIGQPHRIHHPVNQFGHLRLGIASRGRRCCGLHYEGPQLIKVDLFGPKGIPKTKGPRRGHQRIA